jgi:hypothetical protein
MIFVTSFCAAMKLTWRHPACTEPAEVFDVLFNYRQLSGTDLIAMLVGICTLVVHPSIFFFGWMFFDHHLIRLAPKDLSVYRKRLPGKMQLRRSYLKKIGWWLLWSLKKITNGFSVVLQQFYSTIVAVASLSTNEH